ncbi:MAG: DUF3298 domain-containing protein [Cellulosilyticaceae bacterium]
MVKKALFTFLILPMIFTNMCYAKEKETENTPGNAIFVMAIPQEIQVQQHVVDKAGKNLTIHATVPTIKGLPDKRFERKMNKYFKTRIVDLQKQLQNERPNKLSNQEKVVYEVISNYHLEDSMGHLLTVELFDYLYTGGAHGFPYQSYKVIDISENQVLTLKALFDEKVDYKHQIGELIHQQIEERKKEGQVFYDDLSQVLTMNEDERFYIRPNGDLVIIFNVYEIAPYASGVVEFVLPKDQLTGYRYSD